MSLKDIKLMPSERILLPLVLIAAGIGLYAGWRLFWFLTDDAYIAFRYVSNSVLGYGYVWNPPPFRHVEGYTRFLWVILLDGVWRVLGIEPPVSANWMALIFSGLTLFVGIAMTLQMRWHERLRPYRVGFLALVLFGTLTNRTFLAWTSSGLETAMFNFFILLWLYAAVFLLPSTRPGWVLTISTASAAIALTRPDGYLYLVAAAFMMGITFLKKKDKLGFRWFLAMLPMLAPVAHILWRKHFYGEWLPNTYHAKHTT
jgi:arabinofuranosyltransferase